MALRLFLFSGLGCVKGTRLYAKASSKAGYSGCYNSPPHPPTPSLSSPLSLSVSIYRHQSLTDL